MNPDPESSSTGGLPPEFSQLKRPKIVISTFRSEFGLVIGVLWTVFSCLCMLIGLGLFVKSNVDYDRLSKAGKPAQATITRLWVEENEDSTTYHISYHFTGLSKGSPASFTDDKIISLELYETLKVGQGIDILYDPANPGLSALRSQFDRPSVIIPFVFCGMGGFAVVFGLVMTFVINKTRKNLNLLQIRHRTAQAVLYDRWEGLNSEGDATYNVAIAFKVPAAQAGEQIITHAEENKKLYKMRRTGDVLIVHYLPENPSVCRIIE
jgi:hypothetical protein